ncbi:endonuclease, putative [Trichomonas vaginalis G3]|uniref:Endonuclease, putative n=1 Tax=Trichomonas vaginalis (strain ATCC PRA-98 / G3) TaxID=412133 RepID=A2GDW9_TRIV3|nr:HNH endonuclease family [Trichomonas vaginalis G3]EAX84646.1 endonuclease, putative [Trichomonas vaginalis G3]KAI5545060.1 HNH endonuclease family [Trichomonas vaginalis G3]|eukprot:XP_001297576.1 endonuclease [Trichomonas vaginalis G3]
MSEQVSELEKTVQGFQTKSRFSRLTFADQMANLKEEIKISLQILKVDTQKELLTLMEKVSHLEKVVPQLVQMVQMFYCDIDEIREALKIQIPNQVAIEEKKRKEMEEAMEEEEEEEIAQIAITEEEEQEEEEEKRDIVETWEELKLDNTYEISSNYPYRVRNKTTKKVLKPFLNNVGHYNLNLTKFGTASMGKIVASQWVQNPQKKTRVKHIDGNNKNNRVSNLEWYQNILNTKQQHLTQI